MGTPKNIDSACRTASLRPGTPPGVTHITAERDQRLNNEGRPGRVQCGGLARRSIFLLFAPSGAFRQPTRPDDDGQNQRTLREVRMALTKQQALDYHSGQRPGKIEVVPTKACRTQRDLSLAYTPGVAVPCLEIEKHPHDVFKYTGRGNLVAVVSNGTAVLGLGDIGAL